MGKSYEFAIIGSGPAAAMAAQTLLEAGKEVLMLDVGIVSNDYDNITPDKDFLSIRREEQEQHQYFLGKSFETIQSGGVQSGAQLTPARAYMTSDVNTLTPILSDSFKPVESLAYGGLGVGWGLGCSTYSDHELEKTGLPPDEMRAAYNIVAKRIGISSACNNLSPFINEGMSELLSQIKPDNATQKILAKAARKKFDKKGIYFGLPSMATLTEDFDGRRAVTYNDMDFYSDSGHSNWRPWMTIDKLRKSDKLFYINNHMVLSFKQEGGKVGIRALNLKNNKIVEFRANKLLLGAGALGNARILLRSQKQIDRLPILCNPYAYLPCLQPSMLGIPLSQYKTSMAQGSIIYDPEKTNSDLSFVSLYTYRSLLLQRLINMLPFAYSHSLKLLRYLQSSFIIAGIHHPDYPSSKKYLSLVSNSATPGGDMLSVHYSLNPMQKNEIFMREKTIKRALLRVGCIPLKRIDPGYGSSIHYGGCIPFSDRAEAGTQLRNGSLTGHDRVFVLDASGFAFLPAKGLTLSIMANAHRVSVNALKSPE